jgi:hypothetical protein
MKVVKLKLNFNWLTIRSISSLCDGRDSSCLIRTGSLFTDQLNTCEPLERGLRVKQTGTWTNSPSQCRDWDVCSVYFMPSVQFYDAVLKSRNTVTRVDIIHGATLHSFELPWGTLLVLKSRNTVIRVDIIHGAILHSFKLPWGALLVFSVVLTIIRRHILESAAAVARFLTVTF